MANENIDMKRMQQEAIHRVQEMQNRANQKLRGTPSFPGSSRGNNTGREPYRPVNHVNEPQSAHHKAQEAANAHGKNGGFMQSQHKASPAEPQNIVGNLIDGVMKDSERTLIMILLLLLFNEKADSNVIFSLLYLLL